MSCSFKEANGHVFASSLTASITLRNHAPQSYVTRLAVALSDLDMMIILSYLDDVPGSNLENFLLAFGQSEKR